MTAQSGPVADPSATPTLFIQSVSDSAQTQIRFSIANFPTNLYGYQITLSNLIGLSSPSLTNQVANWYAIPSSNTYGISLISVDLSLTNPLQYPTQNGAVPLATFTAKQSLIPPIGLYGFTLTSASAGSAPLDLNLNAMNYNVVISGSTGVMLKDALGSNQYIGGAGLNTLVYPGIYTDYKIIHSANSLIVSTIASGAMDSLQNFDRLVFSDAGIAFDTGGNAGRVAKILGALWGSSFVNNMTFVGIGLKALDGGTSYQDLLNQALTLKLGSHFSNSDEINLLYQNLLHQLPSSADLNNWELQINQGKYTQGSLALMACESDINTSNIHLTGVNSLESLGIHFIPQ